MKDMSSMMSKQHDLLRMIVQKMDINMEDDFRDEGSSTCDSLESLKSSVGFSKNPSWTKPAKVFKQSAIITKWKDVNKHPKP